MFCLQETAKQKESEAKARKIVESTRWEIPLHISESDPTRPSSTAMVSDSPTLYWDRNPMRYPNLIYMVQLLSQRCEHIFIHGNLIV